MRARCAAPPSDNRRIIGRTALCVPAFSWVDCGECRKLNYGETAARTHHHRAGNCTATASWTAYDCGGACKCRACWLQAGVEVARFEPGMRRLHNRLREGTPLGKPLSRRLSAESCIDCIEFSDSTQPSTGAGFDELVKLAPRVCRARSQRDIIFAGQMFEASIAFNVQDAFGSRRMRCGKLSTAMQRGSGRMARSSVRPGPVLPARPCPFSCGLAPAPCALLHPQD